MPRIDVNGLRTHYQQAGEGPDVVLVHAFTGNLSVWMMIGLLDELARDFRVTAYDLRGHGLSEVTESGYDSARMADDLRALHTHLGLGPAYLVGHSYGGVIATHAAVRHPEIVRGVIAADTYFPGLAHIEENIADTAIWTELRNDLAKSGLDVGERVDFARLFEVIKNLTPEQSESIRQTMGPAAARWLSPLGKLAGTKAGTEMFATAGLTEEVIQGVDLPFVGLYDDKTTFGATCRYLEAHLPHCRIDTVPGARHIAPLQSPEEFVRLVKKHLHELAGLSAAGRGVKSEKV